MVTLGEMGAVVGDLRRRVLDAQREAPRAMLDCAAHMLLYADDLPSAERIGLRHLLERFDGTRIDLGYATPESDQFVYDAAECRANCDAPSTSGARLPNRDPGIQVVWRSSRPVYLDFDRDPRLARMRPMVRERFRTRVKLARRLEVQNARFGIICIDNTEERARWSETDHDYFDRFVSGFLGPVLHGLRGARRPSPVGPLTETEKDVVRLAILGLSYKEIARRLGKSPNTVDNQLRRIRFKLGVHNQVELVRAAAPVI
jgi:DNA-binding CsgD family transcriptional regulator